MLIIHTPCGNLHFRQSCECYVLKKVSLNGISNKNNALISNATFVIILMPSTAVNGNLLLVVVIANDKEAIEIIEKTWESAKPLEILFDVDRIKEVK